MQSVRSEIKLSNILTSFLLAAVRLNRHVVYIPVIQNRILVFNLLLNILIKSLHFIVFLFAINTRVNYFH